jgi:mRNA interferase MazF
VKRGDIVAIALQGDYGKPRPALIIQSDLFGDHPSLTILPITSEIRNTPLFRITLMPDRDNKLKQPSQIMVDKPQTIVREKAGSRIGHVDDDVMLEVNRALALFLGIA